MATHLPQNQDKIFPEKLIVYTLIPESLFLPSAQKPFYRQKRKRCQSERNQISNLLHRNGLS